jgi:hypothetical protein
LRSWHVIEGTENLYQNWGYILAENKYQASLIKTLKQMFPGCIVLKNDPGYQQGMLDLLILWGAYWASLEVKDSAKAQLQPNQEFFVRKLDDMSFAAFIYPENEAEVLGALQQAFAS